MSFMLFCKVCVVDVGGYNFQGVEVKGELRHEFMFLDGIEHDGALCIGVLHPCGHVGYKIFFVRKCRDVLLFELNNGRSRDGFGLKMAGGTVAVKEKGGVIVGLKVKCKK